MRQIWKSEIPGHRPLATPAVADGRLFLGGGFGSHEFYAIDARTGAVIWEYRTHDDGPTAAVVEDGYVVFNTESCELEVLTLEGKPVWKKWLGDPLMSMPAVANGRIYMAYPDSRTDHQHYLACFGLREGNEFWKRPIAGDIITAPTVADGRVHVATLDGTLYCFEADQGGEVWMEKAFATSSPLVWKKRCFYSRRRETTATAGGQARPQQNEELNSRGVEATDAVRAYVGTRKAADYLDYGWRSRSPRTRVSSHLDDAVGFSGPTKGSSKMWQAMQHLGYGTVHGVWSHQGSKPFIYRGRMYSAMGDTVVCTDPDTEHDFWRQQFQWKKGEADGRLLDNCLTPPALVNGKVFVGSVEGRVLCLSAEDGEMLADAQIGEPIAFQPAIAVGRVYVPGTNGGLYCLETDDPSDDGWLMWGANAAHNGMPEEEVVSA
jgi:Ca-activated chloride channel homolog